MGSITHRTGSRGAPLKFAYRLNSLGNRSIIVSRLGKFKLLDINLRKKCYTGETLESSLEQATILKLNEEELTVLVGLLGLQGASAPD
jgi:hypothetical protein